jgi:hypothetical protein
MGTLLFISDSSLRRGCSELSLGSKTFMNQSTVCLVAKFSTNTGSVANKGLCRKVLQINT